MSLVDRQAELPIENNTSPQEEKIGTSLVNKLKIFGIIAIIIFVLWSILYSFYNSSTHLIVDNPLADKISFQINNLPIETLQPYETKILNLNPWIYQLRVNGELLGNFEKKYSHTNAFLNPTQDIYVKEHMVYGDEAWYEKLPNNRVKLFNDEEIEWPFETFSGYYILWDWDYSFDEIFPESVSLGKYESFKIKTKLYRYDDFVEMYNEYYVFDENWSGATLENTSSWEVLPQ